MINLQESSPTQDAFPRSPYTRSVKWAQVIKWLESSKLQQEESCIGNHFQEGSGLGSSTF